MDANLRDALDNLTQAFESLTGLFRDLIRMQRDIELRISAVECRLNGSPWDEPSSICPYCAAPSDHSVDCPLYAPPPA
jgi:hypothetical protein